MSEIIQDFFENIAVTWNFLYRPTYTAEQSSFIRVIRFSCALLSIIACVIFFAYYLYCALLHDLLIDLFHWVFKTGKKSNKKTRRAFFSFTTSYYNRFMLYMEIGCLGRALTLWVDFIFPDLCKIYITGFSLQFWTFMALLWAVNVSIVVLVEIFVGKKRLKCLFCKRNWTYSIFTECWTCSAFLVIDILFSVAPFFVTFPTIIYGSSGGLCWINGGAVFLGQKGLWQMFLYHFELWGALIFIMIFYFLVMMKSCVVCVQLRAMEHKLLLNEKLAKRKKNELLCVSFIERQIGLCFHETNAILFNINPNAKTILLHQLFLSLWKLTFIPFMALLWFFPAIDRLVSIITGKGFFIFACLNAFASLNGVVPLIFIFSDPISIFKFFVFLCCCPCCSIRCLIRQQNRRSLQKEENKMNNEGNINSIEYQDGNSNNSKKNQKKSKKKQQNDQEMEDDLLSVLDNDYSSNMMEEYAASIHYTKYEDKLEKQIKRKGSKISKQTNKSKKGKQNNQPLLENQFENNSAAAGEIEYKDNETEKDFDAETEVEVDVDDVDDDADIHAE